MIYKLARFKVKPEELETCLEAIRTFLQAVHEKEPGVKQYESYQLKDPTRFLHFMAFEDEAVESKHQRASHTMNFVDVLYPQCEEEPVFEELSRV